MAKEHAGPRRESRRLIPLLDIDALNGDVQSLFVDAVHALIGKNLQKLHIKALQVRASPLQQGIVFPAPDRVGHGNGFILALRPAVQDDVQPGQGRVLFRHIMRIIIIPADDRFTVRIMGEEDRAARIDKTDPLHGVHDLRAVIILCIVHEVKVAVLIQPRNDRGFGGCGRAGGQGTDKQSQRHECLKNRMLSFFHRSISPFPVR